jgi:CBS domain containing-hemolysin-like protein
LGRLPESGDRVTIEGWTFQVESVDGFRVETVSLVSGPELT